MSHVLYQMLQKTCNERYNENYLYHLCILEYYMSLKNSSFGVLNSGDPSLIPGLGRSAGEEIGYLVQYSWASLVAQLVKNPPTMRETWVRSLGWEDLLEKGKATYSGILAWRIPWTV